eukprot:15366123-Ditylum_brightwellii.AAC.1
MQPVSAISNGSYKPSTTDQCCWDNKYTEPTNGMDSEVRAKKDSKDGKFNWKIGETNRERKKK